MTSTRRKTFATPLEFWQWAIMEPGKRKAFARRTSNGNEFVVRLALAANGDYCVVNEFGARVGDLRGHTFTAVEDEHGVIPELEYPPFTASEGVINWIEDVANCMDPKDRRNAAVQAANFIKMLIDERIAAATVAQDSVHGFPERVKNYYLLPKGDK